MKKTYLLLSVLSLALISFSGCESTPDENATTGPGGAMGPDEDVPSIGIGEDNRLEGGTQKRGMFSPIHFGLDSAKVQSRDIPELNKVVQNLKANPDSKLLIEGNCDERGTSEYNRALGERRALAAREFIVRAGISASRVSTVSYGKDKPANSGHNEGAWAQNRRDDFVIVE